MRIRIKKIDALLFKEFIPPFIMAYLIALFVLMMQFLWLYIDDIAGKGVGLFVLAEMIYYMGVSLIPMALPIGVLLASVMVYGTLAEKYELPSLKTAGIPLMRVMRSSMVFAALVSLSSFLCNNYVIPYANLKFRSRLYDIKKQKPALYLESGTFNDDFQGYAIRIGKKHADNRTIEDVMIDDDASNNRNQFNLIRAKSGEMYVTDDEKYFVMNLQDGHQYQKISPRTSANNYPFVRTSFSQWTKTFDLTEFDLRRTNEDLFRSYHAMLSVRQLADGIDSIDRTIAKLRLDALDDTQKKMYYLYAEPGEEVIDTFEMIPADMPQQAPATAGQLPVKPTPSAPSRLPQTEEERQQAMARVMSQKQDRLKELNKGLRRSITVDQPFMHRLHTTNSIISTFSEDNQVSFLEDTRNIIRSSKNKNYESRNALRVENDRRRKHLYQLHSKYGFALVCFIFLFIGAPMGAIVRKGGFGYPLLVAIFFFMFFVILTKIFEKLSKSHALDPVLAAWLPCVILFPLGLFLTVKAMNDSKLLNTERITAFFVWVGRKLHLSGQRIATP